MDSLQSLPPLSTLSTSVSSALNAKLGTNHDLTQAPSIVAEFLTQCDDLERNLVHLNRTLESNLASYASFSNRIGHLFGIVNSKLTDLGSSVCLRSSVSDGEGLGEELPSLAKEVARVEAVRAYAGTQKFKMPKQEVRIADVFQAVENAKSRFTVFAWGLADTTLEDVFIKVARGAQGDLDLWQRQTLVRRCEGSFVE